MTIIWFIRWQQYANGTSFITRCSSQNLKITHPNHIFIQIIVFQDSGKLIKKTLHELSKNSKSSKTKRQPLISTKKVTICHINVALVKSHSPFLSFFFFQNWRKIRRMKRAVHLLHQTASQTKVNREENDFTVSKRDRFQSLLAHLQLAQLTQMWTPKRYTHFPNQLFKNKHSLCEKNFLLPTE